LITSVHNLVAGSLQKPAIAWNLFMKDAHIAVALHDVEPATFERARGPRRLDDPAWTGDPAEIPARDLHP
jgi:hypothetical protein